MSAGLRSEDQFLCSICLDLFTDPVSTPCGHNFCKTCISQHWNSNVLFNCPLCKEQFSSRPQLRVNTLFREMVDQFRHEAQQKSSSSSEQQAAGPGEVPCDVCTGPRLKALKSCLVCLLSYCQTHLEPHLTAPRLKRHQLLDPVENLEDRMCSKHEKPLELFCKTDQTCVCSLCPVLDHKTHEFVSLTEECEGKKAELRNTEAEVQQMIQNRRLKIQEIKESLRISKAAADRETAEGLQVFTDLMDSVERNKKSFMKEMEDKQKTTEKQAEDFIKDLDQEISELMKRSSEMKKLSGSEDHLHLLQSFRSLKAAPPTKNWSRVSVDPPSYEGTVVRAVAQLEEDLRKKMKKMKSEAELKQLSCFEDLHLLQISFEETVAQIEEHIREEKENIKKMISESDLKMVQMFEVDLTLDPKTAHPELILSDDGKQVKHGDLRKLLLDIPERFSLCFNVLGSQSFSSGRFYFQVQVEEKTNWTLGVARKSINRKGEITLSPQNGFWTVSLRNGNEYEALAGPPVRLSLQSGPKKVAVFVDYQEGLVSFYDVDAAAPIYFFTGCCFTEHLYPFFCPGLNDGGKNSSPLIICPVNQSARGILQ